MLEGNDIEQLDAVFSFVAEFVDKATDEDRHRPMTNIHTNFRELRRLSNRKTMEHVLVLQSSYTIQHRIQNFLSIAKEQI